MKRFISLALLALGSIVFAPQTSATTAPAAASEAATITTTTAARFRDGRAVRRSRSKVVRPGKRQYSSSAAKAYARKHRKSGW